MNWPGNLEVVVASKNRNKEISSVMTFSMKIFEIVYFYICTKISPIEKSSVINVLINVYD